MEIERRKNPRFCVRDNAFAVFESEPVKMVPIINISLGGLAIGVNGINISAEWLNGPSQLEILTDDCRFYMDHLPFQLLLHNRNFPPNTGGSFQNIYAVKFDNLMPSQLSRLKYFIRNHTKGGMTPKFIHKVNQQLHQYLAKKDYRAACRNIIFQRPSL